MPLPQNNPYIDLPHLSSAWIYIAIDVRDLTICKIGLTRNDDPMQRVRNSNTVNPFYTLFNSYDLAKIGISDKELRDFERYLHRKTGIRIRMIGTGAESEWIHLSPFDAVKEVEYRIARGFDNDLIDEDGNADYAGVHKYRYEYRPDPKVISQWVDERYAGDYIRHLCDYHENKFS